MSRTIDKLKKLQEEEKQKRTNLGITDSVLQQLSSTIVCFFADGSEEFTAMTTIAMRSFLFHTPTIACGLLTHSRETRDRILAALPPEHMSRVVSRITEPVPLEWNATKFKLDLMQFVTGANSHFTVVVWLDSDTLVFNDMTPFISHFIKQEDKDYYMVRDHAMSDPATVARWKRIAPSIVDIPQACLMAFKRPVMAEFFGAWREAWNEWIYPAPFARLPDPTGGAVHSPFCTEQYALGLALTRLNAASRVLWFERGALAVRPTLEPARPLLSRAYNLPVDFGERVKGRWSAMGLASAASGARIAPKTQQQLNADAAGAVRFRAGVNANSSYPSSYPSSYASSYGARSGGGGGVIVSAPAQRVGGVQVVVEQRPSIVSAPATSASSTQSDWPWNQTSGAESGSVSASSANPVLASPASQQTSNVVINVDVFGGCVYHLYSQWFFYVLSELATPVVLRGT